MNSYLDGEDQLSSKFQTQQKCRPKRRSVFYQQAPIQHENNEHTTSNFNNNSSQLSNSSQNKHHKEEKLPYKDYKCVSELQVFKDDPYLNDHIDHFQYRNKQYNLTLDRIEEAEGSLFDFADSYKKRGFYEDDEENIIYEEWAPGAQEMYLTGEFCSWDRKQHRMERGEYGVWKIKLPKGSIPHDTKVKVHLLDAKNNWVDKIPIYINYAVQYENKHFDGVYWNPPEKYKFIHPQPKRARAPKIYECHIGMSGIEPKVHSFTYFKDNVLPRISKLGYNCIQIMAIAEHPYYGSFGYHVSLPFAISSRFGTPEQFKELIDQAHFYGIQVLIDIVHSHVASNVEDGINQWDGTDHMYFHSGEKGHNKLWDSKLYNYNNFETLRLLISNLQYFLVEYNVDGFRFDGVTSMLYHHHGIGVGFTGGYHEYFGMQFDVESAVYLMLANKLIHTTNPEAITIAEDVSGYPTLCRSHRDGGMGFDFRLQMAVPDKWIKLLKEVQDENWDIDDIVHTLTNRRYKEPCITYAESHDQALVGDKTISMWLFDKEIYHNMSIHQHETLVVSRGMALHKMLRLITLAMGGEGYLNFMGNEFGHPEWIDFPREGNGWSYHHCRRRWDICDDKNLRYNQLYQFDISMQNVENVFQYLDKQSNFVNEKHGSNKVIVYEKSNLLFIFNFHPNQSFENYKVGTHLEGDHIIVLDTDSKKFGGYGRLDAGHTQPFPYHKDGHNGRPFSINLYIPARTAQVLCLVKDKQSMNYKDETLKIDE